MAQFYAAPSGQDIFRQVAHAREGGWGTDLPRFHLRENVHRADEELAARIADAPAPFGGTCGTRWTPRP